ncbi:MAG: NUDIX hydrolase [Rubrobacteraceae bacterium]
MKADLVSGILPVLPDGRMLLLQRPRTGTGEPPAGRLVPGESFTDGAIRELYEETGLLAAPQGILATWVGESLAGAGFLASVTHAARVPAEAENVVRLSHEHLDHRWTTPEEWMGLPSWWSPENVRGVAGPISRLPEEPDPPPPAPVPRPDGVVRAVLGAGTVLVDPAGDEPRALLLRRRKPPVGLWENPGGALEPGEDFVACARREVLEETGIAVEPEAAWWTRVEPWKAPQDPELYAGVGFMARAPTGEIRLEDAAHDDYLWATEEEWRSLLTWYTGEDSDALWAAVQWLGGT